MPEEKKVIMNIPRIADVETAVKIFQENPMLFNKDIQELFPRASSATVCKLKRLANEATYARGGIPYNSRAVITEDAYLAWGLDITSLERRYSKILKRGAPA